METNKVTQSKIFRTWIAVRQVKVNGRFKIIHEVVVQSESFTSLHRLDTNESFLENQRIRVLEKCINGKTIEAFGELKGCYYWCLKGGY